MAGLELSWLDTSIALATAAPSWASYVGAYELRPKVSGPAGASVPATRPPALPPNFNPQFKTAIAQRRDALLTGINLRLKAIQADQEKDLLELAALAKQAQFETGAIWPSHPERWSHGLRFAAVLDAHNWLRDEIAAALAAGGVPRSDATGQPAATNDWTLARCRDAWPGGSKPARALAPFLSDDARVPAVVRLLRGMGPIEVGARKFVDEVEALYKGTLPNAGQLIRESYYYKPRCIAEREVQGQYAAFLTQTWAFEAKGLKPSLARSLGWGNRLSLYYTPDPADELRETSRRCR